MNYEGPVKAPIKKNDVIGTLKIFYNDDLLEEYNLLAFEKDTNFTIEEFKSD